MALIAQHSGRGLIETAQGFSRTLIRIFVRAIGMVAESNSSLADREIERFVERSGGRLTDSLEREIANRSTTRSFGR
jgi:hypothetical protein